MAYQCVKRKGECDGCGRCRSGEEPVCVCSVCGADIVSGRLYYEIDGVGICSECIRLARRIA